MTSLKVPRELRGTARSKRNEGTESHSLSFPPPPGRRSRNELRPASSGRSEVGQTRQFRVHYAGGKRKSPDMYSVSREKLPRSRRSGTTPGVDGQTCAGNPVFARRNPSNLSLSVVFVCSYLPIRKPRFADGDDGEVPPLNRSNRLFR